MLGSCFSCSLAFLASLAMYFMRPIILLNLAPRFASPVAYHVSVCKRIAMDHLLPSFGMVPTTPTTPTTTLTTCTNTITSAQPTYQQDNKTIKRVCRRILQTLLCIGQGQELSMSCIHNWQAGGQISWWHKHCKASTCDLQGLVVLLRLLLDDLLCTHGFGAHVGAAVVV